MKFALPSFRSVLSLAPSPRFAIGLLALAGLAAGQAASAQATGVFGGAYTPTTTYVAIDNARVNAFNNMVVEDNSGSNAYPFDALLHIGSGYTNTQVTRLSNNEINGGGISDNGNLTYCYYNTGAVRINTRVPNSSIPPTYMSTYDILLTGTPTAACTTGGDGTVYMSAGDGTLLTASPIGSSFTTNTVTGTPAGVSGVAMGSNGNILLSATGGTYVGTISAGAWSGSLVTTRGFYKYAAYQDLGGKIYLEDASTQAGYQYTSNGSSYTEAAWSKPFGVTASSYSSNASGTLMVAGATQMMLQFATSLTFPTNSVGTADPVEELMLQMTTAGTLGSVTVTGPGGATDFTDAGTGTCTTNGTTHTYAAGDLCSVDVVFKPTRGGTRTGTVTINPSSGTTPVATAPLTGAGVGLTVDHLAFTTIPTSTPKGSSFSVTAKAYSDAAGTTVATFVNGTGATVTSSDSAATLPTGTTFTNGVATFNVTLNTVGSKTITVADAAGSASVTSSAITVTTVDHFVYTTTPPTSTTAGTSFSVKVTAYSSTDNSTVATSYTGPVKFTSTDTNAVLPTGSALNMTAGVGTYSITMKTAGAQTLTVADSGGTPSLTSSSVTVNAATAATVLAAIGGGQSATIGSAFATQLKAEVVDSFSNGVGGATVTFTAPGSGASATLAPTSCVTSTTAPVGYCSVTATANGTANTTAYNVSASTTGVATAATFAETNKAVTPTLTVTASPTTLVYGQPVTITATSVPLSAGGSYPTGAVTFYDNTTALTPTATPTNGVATLTTTGIVGTRTYAAATAGDTNFNAVAKTSATAIVVGKALPTLTGPVTTPVFVAAGTTGSVPVSVTGQYSGTGVSQPSGSVTYTLNGTPGTQTITNNVATISTPNTLAPGNYTLTVSYAGGNNYTPAADLNIPLQVGKVTPTVTYPAQTAITYGTALAAKNLNATTAYNGTSLTSGGTTTYTATLGSGTPFAIAVGTVLNAGTYTLTATWTPNVANSATYNSASGTTTLVVNPAGLTVTATGYTQAYGVPIPAFTAAITGFVNGDTIAVVSGSPSFTTAPANPSAVGTYVITPAVGTLTAANYTFTTFKTASLKITTATTSTVITQTGPLPLTGGVGVGVPTTFTVKVTDTSANSTGTPTGNVQFYSGNAAIGSPVMLTNGAGTFSYTFTTVATPSITAKYITDGNFAASTSNAIVETVVAQAIIVTANPSTFQVTQGGSVSTVVTFTPVGNYAGAGAIFCTGLPSESACSAAPASLSFAGDNSPQTATVTFTTTAPSARHGAIQTGSLWVPAFLLAGLLFLRKRKIAGALLVLLIGCMTMAITGCGAKITDPGTPVAASNVFIGINTNGTGYSPALSSSVGVTLVVNAK